jgi:hypothetical protein
MSPFSNENIFGEAASNEKLATITNQRIVPAWTPPPSSDFVADLAKRRPTSVLLKPRNLNHSWTTMLEPCVNCLGAGRIVFGSDMPAVDPAGTLAHVFTARITDADKEHILRYNSLRLLSES